MTLRKRWSRWRQNPLVRRWHLVVGAVGSIGLGWAVINGLDWGLVRDQLFDIPIWAFLLAFVLVIGSMVMRSLRWHVLLQDQPIRPWHTFLTQNTGIGLNNLLPVRMVSEPVQLVIIVRHYRVPGPTALATLVAGNVMDIFATGLLMAMGVIISPELRGVNIQLVGAFILFVVSVLVLIIAGKGLHVIPLARRMRFLQQLAIAIGMLKGSPGLLVFSFISTLSSWVFIGIAGWVIARSLGIELGILSIAALLVAATFFVSAVPSLPGGVGVYEAAMTHTLQLLGVEQATAFTFAVIMHALIFLPPTTIALVMLFRLGIGQVFRRSNGHGPVTGDEQVEESPTPQQSAPLPES